jgi:hypothetical protein
VSVAAFIGGPFAGCWLLGANYGVLGRPAARRQAIVWGAVATVALLVLAVVLPKNFPNIVLPVAYTSTLYSFANGRQGKDYEARVAAVGRQSHWKVVGVALASMILLLVPLVLYAVFVSDGS